MSVFPLFGEKLVTGSFIAFLIWERICTHFLQDFLLYLDC